MGISSVNNNSSGSPAQKAEQLIQAVNDHLAPLYRDITGARDCTMAFRKLAEIIEKPGLSGETLYQMHLDLSAMAVQGKTLLGKNIANNLAQAAFFRLMTAQGVRLAIKEKVAKSVIAEFNSDAPGIRKNAYDKIRLSLGSDYGRERGQDTCNAMTIITAEQYPPAIIEMYIDPLIAAAREVGDPSSMMETLSTMTTNFRVSKDAKQTVADFIHQMQTNNPDAQFKE